MNHLRGIYTIWYRDLLRFWRDKTRMVGSMALPLLFLVVFGAGVGSMMAKTEGTQIQLLDMLDWTGFAWKKMM